MVPLVPPDLLDLLDLQVLQVPYLTVAASDLLVEAALSWGRTLDRGPSDPSGLRGLVVESFSDPFLAVLE